MDKLSFFGDLFQKYLENRCSPEELDELLEMLETKEYQQYAARLIELQTARPADIQQDDQGLRERLGIRLQGILSGQQKAVPIRSIQKFRWISQVAAAAVIILLTAGGWLFYKKSVKNTIAQTATWKNDIAPGANKALLTLADGSIISLDSVHSGLIAKQAGANVTKSDNGLISYTALSEKPADVSYNTLNTPRGGQYQLSLPDGTRAWLNAASSITYPTTFSVKERKVNITGEVYFEVAHNSKSPFRVEVNHQVIEDLGTHFNVNAYSDEANLSITLLEGSVAVQSVKLKQGQQAEIKPDGNIRVNNHIDLDQVMAWKNGFFNFQDKNLQEVLRQLSRWYDIDIVYQGEIPKMEFGGEMDRNVPLSGVLKGLDGSGLHFKVVDKKLVVLP